MNILQAIILGMVQGLGEFLPISSSAHLIATPWLFGWKDPGLGFDVALHWGTLLAVLFYFWKDVFLLFKGFWHSLSAKTRDIQNNIYQKLSWLLILASVPGAIAGKLLEDEAGRAFRNPLLVAAALLVFGIVLLAADRYGRGTRNLNKATWLDALLVGMSQALAIIPGVSRSGSTIAAGLGLGLARADAAKFSFLMSIPIIFGAGLLKIKDFQTGVDLTSLVAGCLSSAVFGFLAIKYLLRYLSRHDFRIFVWYRFAAAIVIASVWLLR